MTGGPYRLAEVNVARLRADLDSPMLAGFVAAVDGINLLAEASGGFVWRLRAAHGAVSTIEGDPRLVVNLSVWESYEALHAFVYRSRHGGLVRRRADWFEPVPQPSTALWWIPMGTEPEVPEAQRRLDYLRTWGPSPRAFTLRRRFGPDGRAVVSPTMRRNPWSR